MTANDKNNLSLDVILEVLGNDSVIRVAVVRALARDFPKDFLAPVRLNLEQLKEGGVVSCKEWQE